MSEIERPTTADRICAALTEEIAAGLIEPGQRLDEVGLAERFEASRTPVREALARLVARHVLTSQPGRGVRVAHYGLDELSSMFEAMQELEDVCARLAARRLTLRAKSDILAAQKRCEEAAMEGDRVAFLKANEAFHQAIYAATQNPYMAEIAASFRNRTGPVRARRYRSQKDMMHSIETHRALVDTIFGRDGAQSGNALKERIAQSYIDALDAA